MIAVGFLAGLWTASRRGMRYGLKPDQVFDAGAWLILGTLIGARALFVVTYWRDQFAGQPLIEILNVRHGGLVFYGGLLGASASVMIYVRWKKLALWKLADALAPSIALGCVAGRIGCFLYGCCYGRPTNLPWAVHFPPEHETKGVGVHPTQLYDATLNLCLYAVLAWLYRRKKFDGQIFAVYLMAYAVLRSFVETFRGDYSPEHIHGWFTPAQLLGVGIFAAGVFLFWMRARLREQRG